MSFLKFAVGQSINRTCPSSAVLETKLDVDLTSSLHTSAGSTADEIMDQVIQIANRMIAERTRNITHVQAPPEVEPPPYAASDAEDSDDEDDEDQDGRSHSLKLIINAAHSIRGNGNLVPTSPAPLADPTKFSTLLLHSINQINNAQATSKRALRVELTINCGITVDGNHNVVGAVGLKPKGLPESPTACCATAGAKRKAEEVSEGSLWLP